MGLLWNVLWNSYGIIRGVSIIGFWLYHSIRITGVVAAYVVVGVVSCRVVVCGCGFGQG